MAGEIGVAQVSVDMLKALWAAEQAGGTAAVAAEVTAIAGKLGTSTQAVWNGVVAAQGAADTVVQGWARTVARSVVSGDLGLTGRVAAGAAQQTARHAAPGILAKAGAAAAEWWAGLGLGAQVVLVAGVLVVVVGGISWVAGVWSDDPDTAATAVEIPTNGGDGPGPPDDRTDFSGDGAVYAGGDVTLDPTSAFSIYDFSECSDGPDVDGHFELELIEDGQPVEGDLELGGNVVKGTAQPSTAQGCDNLEVTCRLEFLFVVRVRGGAITYEFTFGRVFGPGHRGTPCDRSDYVEQDSFSGEAVVDIRGLTEDTIEGVVVIEDVPFVQFSGRRRS